MSANPLIPDREAEFLLHEVADAASLCKLPAFSEYSAEAFDIYLDSCRRLARMLGITNRVEFTGWVPHLSQYIIGIGAPQ